jgi:hypothetical protein
MQAVNISIYETARVYLSFSDKPMIYGIGTVKR